jgi:hypothetical protein
MVYLRHPSRVLPPSEAPYPPLLGIVAAQLKVTPAAWSQYAKRDETRREHLQGCLIGSRSSSSIGAITGS